MADFTIPFVNSVQAIWHVGAWGLTIIVAALWAWELKASRRQAKTETNVQEWSVETYLANSRRYEEASAELPSLAERNSDILRRISGPAT